MIKIANIATCDRRDIQRLARYAYASGCVCNSRSIDRPKNTYYVLDIGESGDVKSRIATHEPHIVLAAEYTTGTINSCCAIHTRLDVATTRCLRVHDP